jgi:hypothetical protein
MQLNPHKFESIPEYVIEECVRLMPMASLASDHDDGVAVAQRQSGWW